MALMPFCGSSGRERGVCMLPTIGELQQMKKMDIREADRNQLKDISEIQFDKKLEPDKRIRNYLEQVHNPFFVKAGEYVLQFKYADSGRDMNDCMLEYISKMTKIQC